MAHAFLLCGEPIRSARNSADLRRLGYTHRTNSGRRGCGYSQNIHYTLYQIRYDLICVFFELKHICVCLALGPEETLLFCWDHARHVNADDLKPNSIQVWFYSSMKTYSKSAHQVLLDTLYCCSQSFGPVWSLQLCPHPAAMPRPAAASCPRPSCDVERVHREWKDTPAVRHVSVRRDRLFESHQPHPDSDEKVSIKFCIKDVVHNQYVLIPLLRRMAHDEKHPLPSLKSLITQTLDIFWSVCNDWFLKNKNMWSRPNGYIVYFLAC